MTETASSKLKLRVHPRYLINLFTVVSIVSIINPYNGEKTEARLGLPKKIKLEFTGDFETVEYGLDDQLRIAPALIILTKSAPDKGQLPSVPSEAPSYDGRVAGNVTWTGSGDALRGTAIFTIKSVRVTDGVKYRFEVRRSRSDRKDDTVELVVVGKVFIF